VSVRVVGAVLFAGAIATPALAQEPVGCDKFKWPLDKERATLTGTDLPKVNSGDRVPWPIPWATIVALKPLADAKLPTTPEFAPKTPDTFAGFMQVRAPAKAATYKVTLSAEGWIDVVQNDHVIQSSGATGALGCDGVRKSVKFVLAAAPFIIELSGVKGDEIKMTVSGD
jgi:hypothetical protein